MTSASVQPFHRKYNINIGCFDRTRINPRNITERNTALKIHNNHFCFFWKSGGISFIQAIKELKQNSKVVDNILSDQHVKIHIKYEYKPEKVQTPLNNIIVYDLETFNKIRAVPHCSWIYKLSQFSGKCHRDITEKYFQKCLND